MFLPQEIAFMIKHERDAGFKPFHEQTVILDRKITTPFRISGILSNSGNDDNLEMAKMGNETYSIFNLRHDITRLNLPLVCDCGSRSSRENGGTSPSTTEGNKDNPNEENDEESRVDENNEQYDTFDEEKVLARVKKMDSQGEVFESMICDFLFLNVLNNYSGMMRGLGFSVCKNRNFPSSSEQNKTEKHQPFWGSTLPFSFLPFICRTYATPLSNRSMDLIPLLIIGDGISRNIIRATDEPVKPRDNFIGDFVAVQRACFENKNEKCFLLDGEKVPDVSISSFLSNCRLIRFTGRYSFLRGFPLWKISEAEVDPEPNETSKQQFKTPEDEPTQGFGINNFEDEQELEMFRLYTSNVLKQKSFASSSKRTAMKRIFSSQHYGEIPKVLKSDTDSFFRSFRDGIKPHGAYINEVLQNEGKFIDCLEHNPTTLDDIHKNQKVFLQRILMGCATQQDDDKITHRCDPSKSTPSKEWAFLCQQEYLDITSCLVIPAIEPTRIKMLDNVDNNNEQRVIVEYNENLPPEDANTEAFDSKLVYLGHGSKQALDFLQKLSPKSDEPLTLLMLFEKILDKMRNMQPNQLAILGLGKVDNPVTTESSCSIIFDLVTGRIFSILLFEHYMCKMFVLLKHMFPQHTMVQEPNPDNNYSHPEHPANSLLPKQLNVIYFLFSQCTNCFNDAFMRDPNTPCTVFKTPPQQSDMLSDNNQFILPEILCYENEERTRTLPKKKNYHMVHLNYREIKKNKDGVWEQENTTNDS